MTVYVTGDIHGGADMQKLRDWELGDSLASDDYLIIAGDFGFPWDFSTEECADIANNIRRAAMTFFLLKLE